VVLQGINFRQHDDPRHYRQAVEFMKHDPLSVGALVTTHKLDLFQACRDQFDQLDDYATWMREVSCISKQDGRLCGRAVDPITSGLALEAILEPDYWRRTRADAFVCGAGGSAIAVTWYLLQSRHGENRPARLFVSNRSLPRLREIEQLHRQQQTDVAVHYRQTPTTADSDAILADLAPGSLVINATGLGKDAPGSPLSDAAPWPPRAIAWDFNYRGDLLFLEQARRQQRAKDLRIEDGWVYFIHGWTHVIAEVFKIDIPTSGPRFEDLSRIAAEFR
jgi:shikimate 5-dehydrogenase